MNIQNKLIFVRKSPNSEKTSRNNCYLKGLDLRKFPNAEDNILTKTQQKSYIKNKEDFRQKIFETFLKKIDNYNSFGGETMFGNYYRSTDILKHKLDYPEENEILNMLISQILKFVNSDLIKKKEKEFLNITSKSFVLDYHKFEKHFYYQLLRMIFDCVNPLHLENDLNLLLNDWIKANAYFKDNAFSFLYQTTLQKNLILHCIQYLLNFKSAFNPLQNTFTAIFLCEFHEKTDSKNLIDFFYDIVCLKNELKLFFSASQEKNAAEKKNSSEINEKILTFLDVLEATFDSDSQKTFFLASSENNTWFNPYSLGLFQFYYNLKLTKKSDGDFFYHEFNLPKITLINFTGFRNDFEMSLLAIFPKVQYVSISFEPSLKEDIFCCNNSNNNFEINVNIDKFKLSSFDILAIFENLIFKIISQFEPFVIIMAHSFIFNKNIIENIHLKPSTFRKIIEKLGFISNNRLILCPNLYINENKTQINPFLKKLEELSFFKEFNENARRFSFEERTLKNFKQYLHEMFGCMFLKPNSKNIQERTLKSLQKLNENFQKTLISTIYEFCKKFPHFSYLLPKMLHLQTLQNLKSKILSKVDKKSIITKENKNNDIDQSFLTNKFYIMIFDKKTRLQTPTVQEIILKEENSNFFYYDLKSTVYYVCYDIEKIYFFNVNKGGQIQNFYLDFSEKNNKVKKVPDYDENDKKLVDFSIAYDSLKAIYLIWGRYVSKDFFKFKIFNVDSDLNYGIYKFDIKEHKWRYYRMHESNSNFVSASPRIKASAILFDKQDINEKVIFVFGGMKYNDSFEENEILNIVGKITIKNNQEEYYNTILEKKYYINEYLPLYNSIVIDIGYDCNEQVYEMLMFGGYYDQNIFNKKPNKILFFQIKITCKSSSETCFFESNEINNEELEYPYPSASRNYIFHKQQNRLFFISILFNSVNRKTIDIENSTKNRFTDKFKLKSELSNLKTNNFLEISGIICDITFIKGAAIHNATKKYVNYYKMNDYYLVLPKVFEETTSIMNIFFFKNNNILYYFEKDQNVELDSKIMINSITFKINLNNYDKVINDYLNFQININTSMYSNKSRELFLCVDNFEQRHIFKLSFFNLKAKIIEANLFFKEKLNFPTKCSIFLEEDNLYLLGGKKNTNETNTNLKMNILNKEAFYFPSNLRKMSHPYVVLCEKYLFLVHRKIIYNFEINEKEEKQYLYLEYIDAVELKNWKIIIVNLNAISDIYKATQKNINYEKKIKGWIQKNSLEYIFYIKGLTSCCKIKEFFKINFEKLAKYITKINETINSAINLSYNDESLMEILIKIKGQVLKKHMFKMRMKEKEQTDLIFLDKKGNFQNLSLIF